MLISLGNLNKLVLDAQNSGVVNLADFLTSVEELRSMAVREGEAGSVAQGAVQIMTVHQAKGLEFPIVILGDIARRDRFSRDHLIDERFGLVPPFNLTYLDEGSAEGPSVRSGKSSVYEIAHELERLMEEAESKRLLYVAATRTQDLLILSGAVGKPTRNGKLPKLSGWMGELAGPLGLLDWDPDLDADGGEIHHQPVRTDKINAELYIYERLVEFNGAKDPSRKEGRVPLSSIVEGWDKLGRSLSEPAETAQPLDALFPASKAGAPSHIPHRIIGEVVHRALELWKFPEQGESDFLAWIEVELKKAGIYHQSAIRSGYRRARKILDRFYASELYQRMSGAELLLREVPFQIKGADQEVLVGSIDALFKEGDQWILVEFKTDQIKPGSEIDWEGLDYLEQVSRYLDAAQHLLQARPEPILCFLDHGGSIKQITDRWGNRNLK